jgi:hypothetical protein
VRSEASRPGISSARNTTVIPGRAHLSAGLALSRRRARLDPLFVFITTAPIAPTAPAATARPPNKRFVLFLIWSLRSQISNFQIQPNVVFTDEFEI